MRWILPILALAAPLSAQDDAKSKRAEILAALDLPTQAQALRDKGAEKGQVKEALRAARGKKLKAKETRDLLKSASDAADEHGTVENFGTFVKSQLAAGKRGRDLAAAIRAEHGKRGRGKGHMKEHQARKRAAKGKPDKRGRGKGKAPDDGDDADGDDAGGSGKGRGKGQGRGGKPDETEEEESGGGKGRGKDKPNKGRGGGRKGK